MPYPYGNDLGKKPPPNKETGFELNSLAYDYHPMKQSIEKLDALLKQQYQMYPPEFMTPKSKKNLFNQDSQHYLGSNPMTKLVTMKVSVGGIEGIDQKSYYSQLEISEHAIMMSPSPVAMAKHAVSEQLERIRQEIFAEIDKEANK